MPILLWLLGIPIPHHSSGSSLSLNLTIGVGYGIRSRDVAVDPRDSATHHFAARPVLAMTS